MSNAIYIWEKAALFTFSTSSLFGLSNTHCDYLHPKATCSQPSHNFSWDITCLTRRIINSKPFYLLTRVSKRSFGRRNLTIFKIIDSKPTYLLTRASKRSFGRKMPAIFKMALTSSLLIVRSSSDFECKLRKIWKATKCQSLFQQV